MSWLEARLDEERGRWFLWLPVLFGAGVGLYLAAMSEPPLPLCMGFLLFAATLRHFLRFTALSLIASSLLLMIALGMTAAKLRTLFVDAPVLTRTVTNAALTGWVEEIERHKKAYRITLRLRAMESLYKGAPPRRVRLRYHGKGGLPAVGELIRVRATLRPPPEPVVPGGFDFARHHWFLGLGATGFSYGAIEKGSAEPPPLDIRIGAAVAGLRQGIATRIAAVLEGETAAIAQALIMGERGGISDETQRALTNSGLAHVISISGFHMALTAGSVFWLIRALLAGIPALALARPIKVWAAVGALFAATLYLVVSGAAVTAVRAYIMVVIMFAAVILNRPALSLRNLAIAALLILCFAPESLADPGFQMSFAATAALIAVYEGSPRRFAPPPSWPDVIAVPAAALSGVVITSLAASLAVDPIAAYHFHRIALYSMLGNILAMPAVSLLVMPMALLTLVLMPLGLEALPLKLMAFGIEAMLAVASFVASLPGAVIAVPAFELNALLLIVFGGLWLLLWRGNWRYWGLVPVAAGLALAPFAARPDIWVDRDGQVIAIRAKDGRLAAPKTRKGEFSLRAWLEADGDLRLPRDVAKGHGFQCDEHSCLALVRGRLVSHATHPAALAEDCRRAAVLISPLPVLTDCPGPALIIDARELWEKGAHVIRLDEAIVAKSVAASRGRRPWAVARHRRELIPPTAPEPKRDGGGGAEAQELTGPVER